MKPRLLDLFDRRSVTPEGCWRWTGGHTTAGYGTTRFDKKLTYVHRLARELEIGPIPQGYEVDHLCRVRDCFNPAHLEAVTPRENNLRGVGLAAQRAHMTHCPRGHEFTPDNIYARPDRENSRMCRACCRLREAARTRRSA